jgi:hypothetical protein
VTCDACGRYGGEEEYVHNFGEETRIKKNTASKTQGRWEENIEMDLKETGWEGVDWIDLVQEKNKWRSVVKTLIILRVP